MRYLPRFAHSLIIAALFAGPAAIAQQQTLPVTPTITNGVAHYTVAAKDGSTYDFAIPVAGVFTYNPPPAAVPPPPAPPSAPTIPTNATATVLDALTNWKCEHDGGTSGTGACSMAYPVASLSADATARGSKGNPARGFSMTYTAKGGVRWSTNIAKDSAATHFAYDTYVMSPDWPQVSNLELDINQVTADGRTFILGTQCSGNSKSWEYTLSKGTSGGTWHWVSSNIACNPTKWAPNTWIHIQIFGHRDANDVATYDSVGVDGVFQPFSNAVGQTGNPLGWSAGSVIVNFQIDGNAAGSGAATVYANKLTIYRW